MPEAAAPGPRLVTTLLSLFISKGCAPLQRLLGPPSLGSFQGFGRVPGNAFAGSRVFVKLAKSTLLRPRSSEATVSFHPDLPSVTFALLSGGSGITGGSLGPGLGKRESGMLLEPTSGMRLCGYSPRV